MYALQDGNAFYCSCEQVFEPALRGRPLVVLSNNDGCAIARTPEAKALGVRMGHPAHELKDHVRRHGLILRSANFTLYGDISRRIAAIQRQACARIEVYSIDESFLDLSGIPDMLGFAMDLRERVRRWVGIPNCIGFAPTMTLAKLANKMAKGGAGVVDLSSSAAQAAALANFPVEDVWGVGPRWAVKLKARGIETAAQLRDAPGIGRAFGVVLHRTQRELQGLSCQSIAEVEPDRQQIMVSRSFGQRMDDHALVAEALASFAVSACAKLRARDLVASALWVFVDSDPFRLDLAQHHGNRVVPLPSATADTRVVLTALRQALAGLLRPGIGYKRGGIALMNLARAETMPGDLFGSPGIGNPAVMDVLDSINRRFGRGTAGFAASGWRATPDWRMRQRAVSPRYTTRLAEAPVAVC